MPKTVGVSNSADERETFIVPMNDELSPTIFTQTLDSFPVHDAVHIRITNNGIPATWSLAENGRHITSAEDTDLGTGLSPRMCLSDIAPPSAHEGHTLVESAYDRSHHSERLVPCTCLARNTGN